MGGIADLLIGIKSVELPARQNKDPTNVGVRLWCFGAIGTAANNRF